MDDAVKGGMLTLVLLVGLWVLLLVMSIALVVDVVAVGKGPRDIIGWSWVEKETLL